MLRLLRSKRLSFLAAGAFGLFGLSLACRRMLVAIALPDASAGRIGVAGLDSILELLGFGLIGLLFGLVLTAVQEALNGFESSREWRALETARWEQLFRQLEDSVLLSRNEHVDRSPVPSRQETVDAIHRAIQGQEWQEADRLLETLRVDEPAHPEIDRLVRKVESGRGETIETLLEHINASREVNDSDRVLELYQNLLPILESSLRKSLDEDLARWFMALIQRRLRSGTIQAEVVTLATRVSEFFSGTIEGAGLRAGLPTLRRSVGLCPRCAGPYIGTAQACPTCLGVASS